MYQIKVDDIKINIYRDIIEWAKEFYGMPENAVLQNQEEVDNECMGFANINDKEISVFVPIKYNLIDVKETIAHEVGHIIELKYPTNFEQTEDNDELHELKANHYMDFYLLVDKIVNETHSVLDNF